MNIQGLHGGPCFVTLVCLMLFEPLLLVLLAAASGLADCIQFEACDPLAC